MKGMRRFVGGVLAVGLLGACEPLDEGGGGGIGDVLFTRGFAFVRESDRNVFVVDDEGDPNSPQKLTTVGGVYWPSVSRDARSVVFVQRTGNTFSLQTVPTSGGAAPATLFSSGDAACPSGCTNFRTPTFSPDGRSVVFVFSPAGSTLTSLARVNTDGSGFQVLTPNTIYYGAPSFMPNGREVVAPSGTGLRQLNQIAQVPLDGSGARFSSLGNEVLAVENRVAVSPSGTQVAFDGRLSSGSVRVFVAPLSNLGVGQPQRVTDLTAASVQETWPSWTRTNQLGFLFTDSGGSDPGIYRANVNSTVPSSVSLSVPRAAEPSYGPL